MIRIARLLAAAATTPWAMQPDKLAAFVQILRFASQGGRLNPDEIGARLAAERLQAAKLHPNTDRSISKKPGSIALLSLRGVISNRASMVDDVSTDTGTSCEEFMGALRAVMSNDEIKCVIIDCDSPGGSVYGVPESVDEILSMRGSKPMIAQINGMAASACYWLASAFDEIVLSPSSQAGSIGVYTVFEDVSKMLDAEGISTQLISAGKYKTEGNPFGPLSDEGLAAIQASVDDYYSLFVDAVARGRGVSSKAVMDGFGQGRMMRGPAAVAAGLADRVGTMQDTLARFGVAGAKATPMKAAASTPALSVRMKGLDLL